MNDHFIMTRAEAAEEILGGNPWPKCNRCHGQGQYHSTVVNALNKTEQKRINCTLCRGRGYLENIQYRYACWMLNVEVPAPPQRPTKTRL